MSEFKEGVKKTEEEKIAVESEDSSSIFKQRVEATIKKNEQGLSGKLNEYNQYVLSWLYVSAWYDWWVTPTEKNKLQELLFWKEDFKNKTYFFNKKLEREIKKKTATSAKTDHSGIPYDTIYAAIENNFPDECITTLLQLSEEVTTLLQIKKIENLTDNKKKFKALNDLYLVVLEKQLAELAEEDASEKKLARLKALQDKIKNFKNKAIDEVRFTRNKNRSLSEDSLNNPIIQSLFKKEKLKEGTESSDRIKTAQKQMLAVQKLLTLEKSDDDELSQDLNTIEVKFSAENKITQWWRWLIGDSTGGVADVEPSMAFFIQHPWLSTIFFGYQIRYWSKWLFPLWSDRDLEIYTVLSTLYAYNGRERIAAIYDAIYKNDFSRDTLDISSMKASITFIHEKVTDINRKKYLQNELFLYALCNLCLEIDSKKVRNNLATALNGLSRDMGSNIAIDLGSNIHDGDDLIPPKIVLSSAILQEQFYLKNRILKFLVDIFCTAVATIVAIGLLLTIFANALGVFATLAGLTATAAALFTNPVGILIFCLALIIAIVAGLVAYNTYSNSLGKMFEGIHTKKISVQQPWWKKLIILLALGFCIVAGCVIGGIIAYAGIQATLLFFGMLITGAATASAFFATCPPALIIFTVIAIFIAVIWTIAEIALLWREFSKIVEENSFWEFLRSLRELVWESLLDARSEEDKKEKFFQYLRWITNIFVLTLILPIGLIGLVLLASAGNIVSFRRDFADPITLMKFLTGSLEVAKGIAEFFVWTAAIIHGMFNASLLMEITHVVKPVTEFLIGTAVIATLPVTAPFILGYQLYQRRLCSYIKDTASYVMTVVSQAFANCFFDNVIANPFVGWRMLNFACQIIQAGAIIIRGVGTGLIYPELGLPEWMKVPHAVDFACAAGFNAAENILTDLPAANLDGAGELLQTDVDLKNEEKKEEPIKPSTTAFFKHKRAFQETTDFMTSSIKIVSG